MRAFINKWYPVITALVFVLGLVWTIGKPAAEDFVRQTIDKSVEQRLKKLEDSVIGIQGAQRGMEIQNSITVTDLKTLKESQAETKGDVKETQQDVKEILRRLPR